MQVLTVAAQALISVTHVLLARFFGRAVFGSYQACLAILDLVTRGGTGGAGGGMLALRGGLARARPARRGAQRDRDRAAALPAHVGRGGAPARRRGGAGRPFDARAGVGDGAADHGARRGRDRLRGGAGPGQPGRQDDARQLLRAGARRAGLLAGGRADGGADRPLAGHAGGGPRRRGDRHAAAGDLRGGARVRPRRAAALARARRGSRGSSPSPCRWLPATCSTASSSGPTSSS